MADIQTWGMLPKAQDDATTVDDEISAAIAAHNDDPTAHMAVGQSIDVHRANTIIDHPAGSVLGDKLTATELVFDIVYQTLDGITHSATAGVALGTGIYFDFYGRTGTFADNHFYIDTPVFSRQDKDFVMQFSMWVDQDAPEAWRAGNGVSYTDYSGLFFDFDGTYLTAKSLVPDGTYTSGHIAYDPVSLHLYRIQYNGFSRLCQWFVDGNLVASFTLPGGTFAYFGGTFIFEVSATTKEPLYNFPSLYAAGQI